MLTSIFAGIGFFFAICIAYLVGYLRGFRNGIIGQSVIAANSYKQVFSLTTEEQKKRFEDQLDYERKHVELMKQVPQNFVVVDGATKN